MSKADDEIDRALALMAHLLGPEFVKDAEAGFIKEKNMEIDEETLNDIIAKLNEAQDILLKEVPIPDMTVQEFNATPQGRAVRRIQDVLILIEDAT
jgi:hypothetical protein